MSVKIALLKTSLNDYPGLVSSVFFFPSCNLRCPWCHNRDLVLGTAELISIDEGLAHISKRRSVLGGVVLSGGEPCLNPELPDIIREIKNIRLPAGNLSLSVKLDTNGMFPRILEKLFSQEETRADYIALDLKTAPRRYRELLPAGNRQVSESKLFSPEEALTQSAALIRSSRIAHEYRSLALPNGFFTEKDIEALAPLVDNAPWYFRPFKAGNCLDPAWDSLEENSKDASSRADVLAIKARELGKNGIAPNSN